MCTRCGVEMIYQTSNNIDWAKEMKKAEWSYLNEKGTRDDIFIPTRAYIKHNGKTYHKYFKVWERVTYPLHSNTDQMPKYRKVKDTKLIWQLNKLKRELIMKLKKQRALEEL